MAEIKSIVGQHYNAKGLYAIDLKTTQETELGDKWHYEIIRDPYLSERPIISFITGLKELFIEVIDTRTGRDYKVLYKPANLIYKQEKQNDSKEEGPMDNMAFIKKTAQIC